MNRILTFLLGLTLSVSSFSMNLSNCTIFVADNEPALVKKMAQVLSADIERVCGKRPDVTNRRMKGPQVVLSCNKVPKAIRGQWECYQITSSENMIRVTGSDPRGLAYGVLRISEAIGVSPWYWWADMPVAYNPSPVFNGNVTSKSPSVKFRGFFINDEDWGLFTWSSRNFEKSLGDIGPDTYDKVCELILRLKGNMLAPAMHSCTGAFYSHPESQRRAAEWGIMITTSHCEPMLFNNAAKTEWDKARDGEWNYETNRETILDKFDERLRTTAQYENIYTTGLRGLHDEAMKGSKDPRDRARTLEQVFGDQRRILEKYKKRKATDIPQIFVPYKEALDIYDAGLRVPDDITLVWPDDNYGYMKRVSNATERLRSGGSGLYYHVSYLGAPHDYLWIQSTAPVLMYEELKKCFDSGADRYWLLNVGDIKPMELAVQQFFAMAYDFSSFDYDSANRYQARWLASQFGEDQVERFQRLLDTYYRLAWQRRPEFMGYEMEWDSKENERLHDSDFSFSDGSALQRLADYDVIATECDYISRCLPDELQTPFFEVLGYAVKSAAQMNRKFLMAQLNHETGSQAAAAEAREANDSVNALLHEYNGLLNGKWNQMMSAVPKGWCAKYQLMPELVDEPTDRFHLPKEQLYVEYANKVDLAGLKPSLPFQLVNGIGTDWHVIQMGEPLQPVRELPGEGVEQNRDGTGHLDIRLDHVPADADSLCVQISCVPFWPVDQTRSNRFAVSLDGATPLVCENRFKEYAQSWKLQVLANRKDFLLTLPIDRNRHSHVLSLWIIDPGQMIQKITYGQK